jgi:hypothetical protein
MTWDVDMMRNVIITVAMCWCAALPVIGAIAAIILLHR